MNNDSTESRQTEEPISAKDEHRSAYLCACRLLQWQAERLRIDAESCAMRGMDSASWCHARNLLVRADILTAQLESKFPVLEVPVIEALSMLRQHWETERDFPKGSNSYGIQQPESFGMGFGLLTWTPMKTPSVDLAQGAILPLYKSERMVYAG